MKELTKTRRLIIVSIIFVFVLVIGLITFRKPEYKYQVSVEAMLQEVNNPEFVLAPETLKNIDNIILVDLRNTYSFNKGTLDDAINIPVSDILLKENTAMFDEWEKQGTIVVLFAEDQRAANAPWMLLRQMGYSNMRVLAGGYSFVTATTEDIKVEALKSMLSAEKPALDFAEFMEETSGGESIKTQTEPVNVIPIQRTKKTVTAGGC
ncbi:MAG: hypothetical protein KDC05_14085 [Bacteroidales bacterium]|nr:hypothetical protein [Bacteroidales bacterium]